jgi:hypothetical protein
MTNTNTAYNQNGTDAEKFVEDMTSSAYQEYQKNGAEAARLYD